MYVFGLISKKGGVGKTTLAANLGAILADFGARVLLIDADPQASLSKYYPLRNEATGGMIEMIHDGNLNESMVSTIVFPNMSIVLWNDKTREIQNTLPKMIDAPARIKMAINNDYVDNNFDIVIIDTQGAEGTIQDSAAFACDMMLSPISPDILSSREFEDGTQALLSRLDSGRPLGLIHGQIKALIYKMDQTRDAKAIAAEVNQAYFKFNGKVEMLKTVIRSAVAYKEAATERIPAHCREITTQNKSDSAYIAMHHLAWELFPNFHGAYVNCFGQLSESDISSIVDSDVQTESSKTEND